jgi:hypothetical protein
MHPGLFSQPREAPWHPGSRARGFPPCACTSDPLADIANLRSVRMTVKRGTMLRRADYPPIAEAEWQVGGPVATPPASDRK